MDLTRPAWLEIDLDNLHFNYKEIRKLVRDTADIMAVVKADAYGHGAAAIVRELMALGVKRFGVAHLSEAIHIKNHSPHAQVLVMGYTPDYLAEVAINRGVRLTVYLEDQADHFAKVAKELDKDAVVHLKIETGMNRLGFLPDEKTLQAVERIKEMDNIIIEGMFTHFPAADDDHGYTERSMAKFREFCRMLYEKDIDIPVKHVSNSAAIMNFPQYGLDMVRAGIILYGIYPYPQAKRETLPLKPCISLKAQISHVKTIEKGDKVSYGLTFEASTRTQVATVPVGYADGWSRDLSNKGYALVNGRRVSIIGRICMDQLMLDVTGMDVKRGDEAVLMGSQGEEEITIEEIASQIGQIPASVLCMLTKRLPRVYVKERRVPEVVDYLLEI
ncbi:MAG TPA: alanine racemase [Tissierellaceae bacterium]|nr:alanine racemase [Tissierellaceae bacterium]